MPWWTEKVNCETRDNTMWSCPYLDWSCDLSQGGPVFRDPSTEYMDYHGPIFKNDSSHDQLFLAFLASQLWRGAYCSEYIDLPRMPKCFNSVSTLSFPTTSYHSIGNTFALTRRFLTYLESIFICISNLYLEIIYIENQNICNLIFNNVSLSIFWFILLFCCWSFR